ncbi:uncharacterized protein [Centruroides vittatus]|uniref:uncharacterized protein n=1 Tax=Centruroides vittatus TaxID=120091 RepID=UPI0035106FAA
MDCRGHNRDVLDRITQMILLEGKITRQRLSYFGHVMRANALETSIMFGLVAGSRKRSRPRIRWLDNIKEDTGKTMEQLKNMVTNWKMWRSFFHRVTESRRQLNG